MSGTTGEFFVVDADEFEAPSAATEVSVSMTTDADEDDDLLEIDLEDLRDWEDQLEGLMEGFDGLDENGNPVPKKSYRMPFRQQLANFENIVMDHMPSVRQSSHFRNANAKRILEMQADVHKMLADDATFIGIGSGGSLISACFASVIMELAGLNSKYVTPLEYQSMDLEKIYGGNKGDKPVWSWIFSASCGNPDIQMAADLAKSYQTTEQTGDKGKTQFPYRTVGVGRINDAYMSYHGGADGGSSRIYRLGKTYGGKTFIASESVMASITAMYLAVARATLTLQGRDPDMAWQAVKGVAGATHRNGTGYIESEITADKPDEKMGHLIVLYDPLLLPAAKTIETCLMEQAVVPVQAIDYRNFCHGRHTWFQSFKDKRDKRSEGKDESLLVVNFAREIPALTDRGTDQSGIISQLIRDLDIPVLDMRYSNQAISVWESVWDAFNISLVIAESFGIELSQARTTDNARSFFNGIGPANAVDGSGGNKSGYNMQAIHDANFEKWKSSRIPSF